MIKATLYIAAIAIWLGSTAEPLTEERLESLITADEPPEVATPAPVEYYTEDDVCMVARLMWGEARGVGSETEIACVGWTVCNRVDSSEFDGDTVAEVITAPGQFYYSPNFPLEPELYDLAEDVLSRWARERNGETDVGRVLPPGYCYYSGSGGHNWFRNAYRGGTIWDYSLESPYDT